MILLDAKCRVSASAVTVTHWLLLTVSEWQWPLKHWPVVTVSEWQWPLKHWPGIWHRVISRPWVWGSLAGRRTGGGGAAAPAGRQDSAQHRHARPQHPCPGPIQALAWPGSTFQFIVTLPVCHWHCSSSWRHTWTVSSRAEVPSRCTGSFITTTVREELLTNMNDVLWTFPKVPLIAADLPAICRYRGWSWSQAHHQTKISVLVLPVVHDYRHCR